MHSGLKYSSDCEEHSKLIIISLLSRPIQPQIENWCWL